MLPTYCFAHLPDLIEDPPFDRATKLLPLIAICTRDRAAIAKRCLDSLLPLQKAYGFELLVIDNAPSDQATAQYSFHSPKDFAYVA
jgi:hypothetical protein